MRNAAQWDERYEQAELVWSAEPNRFVAEEVTGMSPGRAIDLAAGEGRNAIWLAGQGWSVEAVDFSRVGIDKGRQLAERAAPQAAARISWDVADLLDYEPAAQAYQLVLIAYLHLPAEQRRQVVRRAAAAVAPGGTLLIVGHARRNLAEGVGGPQDEDVLYDPDEVRRLVADAGLDIERAEEKLRPVDGESRDAIDVLVRATRP